MVKDLQKFQCTITKWIQRPFEIVHNANNGKKFNVISEK